MRKLLQARRADPKAPLAPLARRLAVESAVVPLDSLPNPPFFGKLEKPMLTGGSQFGKVQVEGWIIHKEQRIRRLVASTHPLVEVEMDYGDRERADAGAMFPGHPHAMRSQYFGMVDIDEGQEDPVCLKVFADLDDGTRHLVFVRRFYQRGCSQLEQPLPEFGRAVFIEVAMAFASACRAEGIRLGKWSEYWQHCRKAYRLFEQFAPKSLAHLQRGPLDPYVASQRANALTPRLRQLLAGVAQEIESTGPRFLVLVDARASSPDRLRELADSLVAQIYPHWEACFFVGLAATPGSDPRLQTAATLNDAAYKSHETYMTYLPADSQLSPDALVEIADVLAKNPVLELVYTDEDQLRPDGTRFEPKVQAGLEPGPGGLRPVSGPVECHPPRTPARTGRLPRRLRGRGLVRRAAAARRQTSRRAGRARAAGAAPCGGAP